MQKTRKPNQPTPEGAELPPLSDFRSGFKDQEGKTEEKALPPKEGEELLEGVALQATEASENIVVDKVRKATLVMQHVYGATIQMLNQEIGASGVVGSDGQAGGMPPSAIVQLAMPLAQSMFREVFTPELEGIIEFEPRKEEPKE